MAIALSGCANFSCDEGHPSVAMARGLPPERLAVLHADAMQIATGEHWHEAIPYQFRDLKPVAIRSHFPGVLHIRLNGCMDHHLDLVAFDDGAPYGAKGRARIELWFGEHPRHEEVLWVRGE